MKRLTALGIVTVLLMATTGCAKSPDALMKQGIDQMNDLAVALEKKESPDRIKSLAEKLKSTLEKLDGLKISEDEKKKLGEKYKDDLGKAAIKLMSAALAYPEGAKAMESVGPLNVGKK